MNKNAIVLLLISIFSTANAAIHSNSPDTSNDIWSFKRIGQVLASPDGTQTAFIVFQAKPSDSGKKWQYALHIKDKKGQIHVENKNDAISSLNWSPDGKSIGYLAKGDKYQSIWIEDIKTHHSKKRVEWISDIDAFKWSPDGKTLAFLSAAHEKKSDKRLMPIDVSKDYTNTRLYLSSLENEQRVTSITTVSQSVTEFDWAPDGQAIAYSFQSRTGAIYSNDNKINVYRIDTHQTMNIPYTQSHTGIRPVYSPDGKWLAFMSHLEPSKFAEKLNDDVHLKNRICMVHTQSFDSPRCLANTFNENPGIIGWSAASDHIFVIDSYKTVGYLIYALNIDPAIPAKTLSNIDGFIEPLTVTLNAGHHIFGFGYETVSQAPEAFMSQAESFKLEQISHVQSPSKNEFGNIRVIHWKSMDDMEIEGLLVTPKQYSKHKKYPLFVAVHGGPSQAWAKRYLGGCDEYGSMIDPTSCFGKLLDLGFVIFQPNPRGSTGYGKAFNLANFGDLGGGDYHDIMSGVDHLIQQGIADPDHLAVGGWSFGGYMTAWMISQTDKFKAAVEGNGNTDFISFSGTSDIPNYYVQYLGQPFWEDDKLYLQRAPISYVQNIKTPLLIIGGQNDNRVPITQGYELYTALERQGKSVKMLVLPEQGHMPTDPNLIDDSIKEIEAWLKKAL